MDTERRSRTWRFLKDQVQNTLVAGALISMLAGGCTALGYSSPFVLSSTYAQDKAAFAGNLNEISNGLKDLTVLVLEQKERDLIKELDSTTELNRRIEIKQNIDKTHSLLVQKRGY